MHVKSINGERFKPKNTGVKFKKKTDFSIRIF